MKESYEKKYHDLETTHFWFKSRRNFICQMLKDADKNQRVLDIGCSSGILLNDLIDMGFKAQNLYGIDISDKAVTNAKQNGIENAFVMDAQNIQLDKKFDVLIASDCLEHLQDDHKALQNWYSLLKPGGKLYVFVPAFMLLWSEHDEVNMHYRRYTKQELKSKLLQNGFEVKKANYWNILLFPPVALVRSLSRMIKGRQKNTETNGDLKKTTFNTPLLGLLNFENKFLPHISAPFGVSAYCVVTRPE